MANTNNAVNCSSNGVVGYNNSTGVFSATAMTQYSTLVGGASAQAIVQVAPSATSGMALTSTGASSNPTYANAVVVAGGGTGLTTLTAYELLAAGTTSTGNLQQISAGSAGQVLVSGGAGVLPSFQTALTPAYVNVTGASQTMAVNTGYVANDGASLVTFTPPAVCAVGTVFAIVGNSSSGWSINLATNSQTINYGSSAATTALASTNQYDAVKFVCTVANTTFSVENSQGNLVVS